MRMPFLFRSQLNGTYVVVVASWDYVETDFSWADDHALGNYPLVPDVDIAHEHHTFGTEEAALAFIKGWWSK